MDEDIKGSPSPELLELCNEIEALKAENERLKRLLSTSDEKLSLARAEEQVNLIRLTAAAIAHEVRTPLAIIHMNANGLKKIIAQSKKISNQTKPKRTNTEFERAEIMLKNITAQTTATDNIIDLLLAQTRPSDTTGGFIQISIVEIIEQFLDEYPTSAEELALIHWEPSPDFIIQGDELLIKHVLYNLLKNAFHFIRQNNHGEIFIWQELGEHFNKLHFKDTAQGISNNIIDKIFKAFYSKRQGGSGIGLAFCKMVMEHLGGHIECNSVPNQYTDFVLSFPTHV